ncbi:hypothetical protein [Lentzea xinjiangensis]|uniref:hypothetical protein n=1 Tax=Lentzea xinjiangensis TaxID=402600 RepID=UPI0011605D12|nr:hypothetical protein [Lentzea xinjiangensis]
MLQPLVSDELLDGIDIPVGVRARNWRLEHEVHGSSVLSDRVGSTRNFLSTQVNLVRDEVRDTTWCSIIEGGSLVLVRIDEKGESRRTIAENDVWRSHLVLDKFTGEPILCWITANPDGRALWFQGELVPTATHHPDFPFVALNQVPIGHVQSSPPSFGILTYKCRDSGRLHYRMFEGRDLGPEVEVGVQATVGGLSCAMSEAAVIGRIDAVDGDRVVPMISLATDRQGVFEDFEAVELPYTEPFRTMPASGPPTTDFRGHFHVPIAVADENEAIALDLVLDEALVEAVTVPTNSPQSSRAVTQAFPKKDGLGRFGDGVSDGLGIIMVALADSLLYTSNSQAGGIHFPEKAHLNHEMPKVAAFSSTECYTGGRQPNVVSMDYVYLEADEEGLPLSRELHFETWDMPLPVPQVTAIAEGSDITVTIEKDANFEAGRTTFELDPAVQVRGVEVVDDRHARVRTVGDVRPGQRIGFEVRSRFYHHHGDAVIT